jgi:hypothetical protein
MRVSRLARSFAALAASAAILAFSPARADVAPGDVIGPADAEKVKDLLSPGMQWCVKRGMPITVVETKKIEWPKLYREATEKYSGQVKLDGLKLVDYVAGQPFPVIDPNDPQLATKIMWNYEYRWAVTDDANVRNFDADTGPIHEGETPMSVERHFIIEHVRILRYLGRLHVDPKPVWETKEGYQSKGMLSPIVEPFDLKGVGGLTHRFVDPAKNDDTWLYLPSLRRVRRLSTAQRSDALFGQDIDVDTFYGYAGHIAWMDWKFLGEQTVLAPMHGKHYPAKWAGGSADFAFDDVWEKRQVYVIEGISKLAQYAYSKRILYLDKETMSVVYTDLYDRTGGLWKTYANLFTMRKQPFDGAKLSVYPEEMAFNAAQFLVDIQLQHATRVSLPSPKFAGEEGWYFNMGDKTGIKEDLFTIAHLIKAGR